MLDENVVSSPKKKKKKKHKRIREANDDDNNIDKNDAWNKEENEVEPQNPTKHKKHAKEDFIARKHGK